MSESSQAVFLSYTSQDAEAARRICEALRTAGIEVWLDQSELRGGDAWDSAIRRQIKACVLFLPIISANTSARSEGYFRLECNNRLSGLSDLHGISRTSAFAFQGKGMEPKEIGKRLGVAPRLAYLRAKTNIDRAVGGVLGALGVRLIFEGANEAA